MCIGKKGWDYFSKSMSRALARERVEIVGDYVKLFSNLDFIEVKKATDHILNGFLNDDFQIVDIIYNEFKNVAAQIIRTEQFLPIVENSLPHTIKGVDGKQESGQANKTNPEVDYIFEPSRKQIMNALIPYSLRIRFYKALLESNAAEHGARMTAMDQATDNAEEILRDLRLTYNRTRQAAITKEILEIVGGAEALQGGG
ncbi:MAG: F0F1 ATP synthase subunit gamma [Cytophagales bacterium]|nr:F0F1 ATP synthase subunit gamma [Cytophagales bacterium]